MMKRYFAIVLLLFATINAFAQDATPEVTAENMADCPHPLRIATWNIENFTVSRVEDTDQRAAIVDTWLTVGADIWALQEIGAELALQRLLEEIEAQSGRRYAYALMERRGQQKVGFAWDIDRVELVGDVLELEDVALANLRPALAATFSYDDEDFTLVTLHLKATGSRPSQQIRAAQSKILVDWLNALPEDADTDIIMLGDFNDTYDAESLSLLAQTLDFTADELPPEVYSYIGDDYESLIDHIALSADAADEFCAVYLFDYEEIGLDEDTFEALASDHLPVYADFSPSH